MNAPRYLSKILLEAVALITTALSPVNSANATELHPSKSPLSGVAASFSLDDNNVQSISQWRTEVTKQKAIVLSIHGFSLDKNSYQSLAEHLKTEGISTYSMDIRGFGSWTKEAGLNSQFNPDKTLLDIQKTLIVLREQNPGTPIFLLGESLGGAMALRAATDNPQLVDGVIASVPAAERYHSKRTAFNLLLKNLVGEGSHINIGKRPIEQATSNTLLTQTWRNNPDARLTVSTTELITFSRFMHHNHQVAKHFANTSTLMLQGSRDRLVKPSATYKLFKELKSTDKDFLLVNGSEHLILEEGQCNDSTFNTIGSWLKTHEDLKIAADIRLNQSESDDFAPVITASR